jgi:hypothetical protein
MNSVLTSSRPEAGGGASAVRRGSGTKNALPGERIGYSSRIHE